MNRVPTTPDMPPLTQAANFLTQLKDILRKHAAVINRAADGSLNEFVSITTTYTADDRTAVILCAPSAPFTLTIPAVSSMRNKFLRIKRSNNTTHTITVTPASGNIDGAASTTLTTAYQSRTLFSDGVDYWLIT